jgi:hypothetical protein
MASRHRTLQAKRRSGSVEEGREACREEETKRRRCEGR